MTDAEVKDDDLFIEHGCSATHPWAMGGQHVAMRCFGVRVLHKPTGISVTVDSERSQHQNKMSALSKLADLLSVDIVDRVRRDTVEQYLPTIRGLRSRITTQTLAANLPRSVWSELCRIDSEMSQLIQEMERAGRDPEEAGKR